MSERTYNIQKVKFHHIVLEGTDYEVGFQLGKYIGSIPGGKELASTGKLDIKTTQFSSFKELWKFTEDICPGITQEIQGFSDSFGIHPSQTSFLNSTYAPSMGGECSQLAVLPFATKNKHTLVGRSYEWVHTEEDLKLITTRIKGKASHIGFSCSMHGRHDGLNEHGLYVGHSGGGIFGIPFKHRNPMFWLAIRILLDKCTSVEDAIKMVDSIPMTGFFTLLFADKCGNAAIVEVADGVTQKLQIPKDLSNSFLFTVNYFQLEDTKKFNKLNCGIISHSKIRERIIRNFYSKRCPNIDLDDLFTLFSTVHPDGLCNHFYKDGFGTLWQLICDVSEGSIYACFGASTHNKFYKFDLNGERGMNEYTTLIPITDWY
jgi:predicted choloylglycine hydrolase